MMGVLVFNIALLAIAAAAAIGMLPKRLYDAPLRGLHNTIGITTPTDRQLRWVLAVWLFSTAIIVDSMIALLVYVF